MLSLFRKRKPELPDLSGIATDMHSHLLPGIDDGSPDAATSVSLIRGMMELGYTNFITTPHIIGDIYRNTPETINAALAVLEDELKKENLSVKIKPAAEYLMDDHFEELLEDYSPLLTIKDNWVLIEFSFISLPLDFKDKLFRLQLKGYQPVLAHPERYTYLRHNKAVYDVLKDAGCLFQLNILSLANYYGKASTELANYLVQKQYIDLLGTDLHHERHLEALNHAGSVMNTIHSLLDSGKICNPLF